MNLNPLISIQAFFGAVDSIGPARIDVVKIDEENCRCGGQHIALGHRDNEPDQFRSSETHT